MATTPVLGLRKPARADLVSVVTDINNNMDILDQAYDDLSTVSLNIAMTIPANVWSANAPYTYTWLDARITQKCDIEVGFFSGAESSDLMYLAYEKVPFGIKFTASNKPTTSVPLTIKIINAEAESITSVTGDMVSTSVIPGAANADEALSVLNNNLTNKVVANGNSANIRIEYFYPVSITNKIATVTLAHTPVSERMAFAFITGGVVDTMVKKQTVNVTTKVLTIDFTEDIIGSIPLTVLYASID